MRRIDTNFGNGRVVSMEIDGVEYRDPSQNTDPGDRAKAMGSMEQSSADGLELDKEF